MTSLSTLRTVGYVSTNDGQKVSVYQGNRTSWYKATTPDYSYATFRKYLNLVFCYAGTLSLSKELKSVNLKDMYIGDVFIHGGSPGHAMIVIDAVQNPKDSTDKTPVVAEGYMPAQDMHIVLNNRGDENTPWWSTLTMLQDGAVAFTTYWFDIDDTKTFKKSCSVRTTKTSVIPDEYKVVLSNFGQYNIDCKIKNRKSLCIL